MNEKIEKLIVELEPDAFMTYKGYLYHANDPKVLEHSDPEPLYTRQELEKLVERTVRECADIALKKGMASPDTDFRTGSYVINQYLLTHFGVEE
jgi:hypothetical protein